LPIAYTRKSELESRNKEVETRKSKLESRNSKVETRKSILSQISHISQIDISCPSAAHLLPISCLSLKMRSFAHLLSISCLSLVYLSKRDLLPICYPSIAYTILPIYCLLPIAYARKSELESRNKKVETRKSKLESRYSLKSLIFHISVVIAVASAEINVGYQTARNARNA